MLNRRKVMAFLGAAPVAAGAAAKAAGLSVDGLGLARSPGSLGALAPSSVGSGGGLTETYGQKMARFFLKHAMPEWLIEEGREDTREVTKLDPDIAIKCWSMAIKIQAQRERNLKRWLQYKRGNGLRARQRELFEQEHGFWI